MSDTEHYCNWCGLHLIGLDWTHKKQKMYHEYCFQQIIEDHDRRARAICEETYHMGVIDFFEDGVVLFYRHRGTTEITAMSVIQQDFTPMHRLDGLPAAWQPTDMKIKGYDL